MIGSECSLAEKIAYLSQPRTYGRGAVTVRETRTSWVFLTSDRVYKLKKPIADKDLDFRTPMARHRNASEEVRLNRRLAHDVYIGVVPLSRQANGKLSLGPDGSAVDWLVVMQRLPDARFLDQMIEAGTVTVPMVRTVGERLARLYQVQPPVSLMGDTVLEQLRGGVVGTRDALRNPLFGLDAVRVDRIADAQLSRLADCATEIVSRAENGVFRDGHGDLRPEHVCLIDPPVIIDCLEFAKRLRISDPYDDVGFLALECERLGAHWIRPVLFEALECVFKLEASEALIGFYMRHRAWYRAFFALRHFLDPSPREAAKWRPLAEAYLAIVEGAAAGPSSSSTIEPPV